MDMALIRTEFRMDGIFSELRDASGDQLFVTVEHSYSDELGNFRPKLSDGVYKCVRGSHILEHMTAAFETFEIMNVPGHTNILFHVGNFNADSSGCVCIGFTIVQISGQQAISQSQHAFANFMDLQTGLNEFQLTVKST